MLRRRFSSPVSKQKSPTSVFRCHWDRPTVVRRHRIWFSLENVAQQDFTFGYNRVRVRAKSAALRLGRGSARVAHQGGHWPSCVENSSNNLLQMCQQTVCRDRTDGKMWPMRAGAVNTTKTVIFFQLLCVESHNQEKICERTKLVSHVIGYISCAPSWVFMVITALRVFTCLLSEIYSM